MYCVVGASGSGKTAAMKGVQSLLPHYICYDFDDIGVPDDAGPAWRQEATEQWLQRALKAQPENIILFGQMVPGEIFCAPSFHKFAKIKIIVLDVSDDERIKRLKNRGTYGLDQHTLNWSAWLRMHVYQPSWQTHVLTEHGSPNIDLTPLSDLDAWPNHISIHTMDTTDLSIQAVSAYIAQSVEPYSLNVEGDSIVFTVAQESDLPALVALLKDDMLGQTREASTDNHGAAYQAAYQAIVRNPNAVLIIAKRQDEVLACAQLNFLQHLTHKGALRAHVEGVRVKKNDRQKGLGEHLFHYIERLARIRGCMVIQLMCDNERTTAHQFYRTLGFHHSHAGLKKYIQSDK